MSYASDLPSTAVRQARQNRPSFGWVADGAEASDAYYVPWADFANFMYTVAGRTEGLPGGPFGLRWIPLRYPEYLTCIAYSASAEYVAWDPTATPPNGGGSGWFKGAIVRLSYRTPAYPLSGGDALMTLSGQQTEYPMQLAPGALTIGTGTNPGTLYRPVGGEQFSFTLHNLISFDPSAWTGVRGVINLNAWRGYAAKTVKMPGLSYERQMNVDGSNKWSVTLPFQSRAVAWDQEYDATGTLGTASLAAGSEFTAVDFASTFGF
jgi:hypothetical protein